MTRESLGARLKALREAKGLTKYRLAKLSTVSQTYIYRIERGEIQNPRRDTLQKLADALSITVAELIGDIAPVATWQLVELSLKAYIPIYNEVRAGEDMEPVDYMAVTRAATPPPTLRGYRVETLYLEPEIRPGDTVFVDTAGVPIDGDLVVAIRNSLAFLARYKADGGKPYLQGTEAKYKVDDVVIFGVVTGYGHVFRRT